MDPLNGTSIIAEEILRLMGATLQRMGYEATVDALEAAGVQINTPNFENLRTLVLNGMWGDCLALVEAMEMTPIERRNVLSAVTIQQFMEIVQAPEQDADLALSVLRRLEMIERVDDAAGSLVLQRKLGKLMYMLLIPPQNVPPRFDTLIAVERALKPGEFVADRLIELLEETLSNQRKACLYHNSIAQEKSSLFGGHNICTKEENIPCKLQQIARDHTDNEILHLRFSNNGHFLASFGRGATIIWRLFVGHLLKMRTFEAANVEGSVGFMCWSPDDSEILISRRGVLGMWNVSTGECVGLFPTGGQISCCWTPSTRGSSLIFTLNSDHSISKWERFNVVKTWEDKWAVTKPQLCSKDNKELVYVSHSDMISIFNWETEGELQLNENNDICAFNLSRDGKSLLVSLNDNSVSLWRVDGERSRKIKVFHNLEVGNVSLGVCFGGLDDVFVVTTCNYQVHIWNTSSSELVCTLEDHEDIVRCVCWNPSNPTMFVSGANNLRLWGIEADD